MSHELINLRLPIIIQDIEDALDEYPEHPYRSDFSTHEFRQKLTAHVLRAYTSEHTTIVGLIL